ncbi:hypothetical protein ONS95_004492 [Cadophora gregata]|uniref:uncharacterized protein n=1 Tax=Cadophora gregata TaxID=51156 RepID=UPI0026DD083C|nr:uncharacterized protein ONS95_004492 [Cadophora gregata]KAK0105985.1 hypothetical protein ONS95_004492 [Cadophora gregata]
MVMKHFWVPIKVLTCSNHQGVHLSFPAKPPSIAVNSHGHLRWLCFLHLLQSSTLSFKHQAEAEGEQIHICILHTLGTICLVQPSFGTSIEQSLPDLLRFPQNHGICGLYLAGRDGAK